MERALLIVIFLTGIIAFVNGQERTSMELEEAYQLLESRYPLLKNELIEASIHRSTIQQLKKERLPEINLKSDLRLQSQSVNLDQTDMMLPINIDQPIYSAKAYVELNYLLLDGGLNKAKAAVTEADYEAGIQAYEIDRYKLKSQINQLFVRISQHRAQLTLLEYSIADLDARYQSIQAMVDNGIKLASELDMIEVRKLELFKQKNQISSGIRGSFATLSYLTGEAFSEETELVYPGLPELNSIPELDRPELEWYALQKQALLARNQLIESSRKPKLNLFAQAGAGAPNPLNFIDRQPAPYALIGAGFSWKITDWKHASTEKEKLALQAIKLDNQKQNFEFNIGALTDRYLERAQQLLSTLEENQKIAELHRRILDQNRIQLEEGVLTSSEYLSQLNTELAARQALVINRIDLLALQLEFLNERGAFQTQVIIRKTN